MLTRDGRIGLIDARDLAEVYVQTSLIDRMANETFNIQGHSLSFHEFVTELAKITGLELPAKKTPYRVAYMAGATAEFLNRLRGRNSDRGLSRYRIRTLASIRTLDTSKLHSVLEFHPRPWKRTLEDWWKTFQSGDND